MLVSCLAYYSTLKMRRHAPPKHRLTFNRPHGVISQKIEPFLMLLSVRNETQRFIKQSLMNILSHPPFSLSEIRGKKIRDKLVWNINTESCCSVLRHNCISWKGIYRAIFENIEIGYFVLRVLHVLLAL
jgi:hypothetical protein